MTEQTRRLPLALCIPVLCVVAVVVAIMGLVLGAYPIALDRIPTALLGQGSGPAVLVLQEVRLPRLVLGALTGAVLAMSGAVLQGLFRNPLADPGLIGVSSGAALGAVSVIVLGQTALAGWLGLLGHWALPLAAFIGGLAATWLAWAIASRQGDTDVATLLLAGIAINAVAGAGTGILTFMADDAQLRSLTFWSMGSIAQASWSDLRVTAPSMVLVLLALPWMSRALNAFLMGESVAGHLGFSRHWVKRCAVVLVALGVGAAVAVTGLIGFVGLVVPHIVRMALGADHRTLLPISAAVGAILMVLADCLARTIVAPAELPIGLVMASLGGPFFLFLLLRRRRIGHF